VNLLRFYRKIYFILTETNFTVFSFVIFLFQLQNLFLVINF